MVGKRQATTDEMSADGAKTSTTIKSNIKTKTKTQKKLEWKKQVFEAIKNTPFVLKQYGGAQAEVLLVLPADYADRNREVRAAKEERNRAKLEASQGSADVPALETLEESVLKKLFEGTPGAIRETRSFRADRERQVLRWAATCLLTMYPKGVEVQCYYREDEDKVYIASNDNEVNKQLRKLFEKNNNNVVDAIKAGYTKLARSARPKRHAEKLTGRATSRPYPEQDPILTCLQNGRIVLVEGTEDGLHAERRIRNALQERLSAKHLAGVKRPCLVCAVALDLIGESFPGPAWTSAAATQGVSPTTLIKTLSDHVDQCNGAVENVVSYVTKMRTGELNTGYDTESDSDPE